MAKLISFLKSHLNSVCPFSGPAVFFFLVVMILWSGCARQLRKPPVKPRVPKSPLIRVAITDHLDSSSLSFKGKYKLESEEAIYILDESVDRFTVTYRNGELIFSNDNRWFSFKNFKSIEFLPLEEALFNWNNVTYQGYLTFVMENERVYVINMLEVEQYLRGVVPHEIPSSNSEHYQAVKAQAIAARTYALFHVNNSASKKFDVYADTRDQVYRGMERNSELSDRAVGETSGQILQNLQGQLVEIQYHSTCGGFFDVEKESSSIHRKKIIADTTDSGYNCVGSPLYRWIKKVRSQDILKNLVMNGFMDSQKSGQLSDEGFSLDLRILSRSQSGRINKLLVSLEEYDFSLSNWQIRKVFMDNNSRLLPSDLFFLKKSQNSSDLVYIVGAGYGHGRGMCQWGAIGQALKGKSAERILRFYYPQLQLNKIY